MEQRLPLSPRWTAARDDLRARRACRTSRKSLVRELASYSTPAEQLEFDAILNRADPQAADEIRRLLQRNRIA
jgi:hypothetical protein